MVGDRVAVEFEDEGRFQGVVVDHNENAPFIGGLYLVRFDDGQEGLFTQGALIYPEQEA